MYFFITHQNDNYLSYYKYVLHYYNTCYIHSQVTIVKYITQIITYYIGKLNTSIVTFPQLHIYEIDVFLVLRFKCNYIITVFMSSLRIP